MAFRAGRSSTDHALGTNSFHGSVYDFFRDDSLDANDWFANRNGEPIPPLRRNNYGFTFGGPIIKNKTFFFVDYDGLRSSGLDTATAGVPTDLMRAGDFGEVCATQGGDFDTNGRCSVDAGQIWDPYSGTFDENRVGGSAHGNSFIPFNNLRPLHQPGKSEFQPIFNRLPASGNLIDPVAQKMISLFPEPNLRDRGIYENWFGSGSRKGNNDQFDVKIDHRFTENNMISAEVFISIQS